MATDSELSPKQVALIGALLATGDVSKAAESAGVARATAYKWQKLPAFRQALRQAQDSALTGLARQLAGLSDAAAAAVRDGLSEEQNIAVRLRAAALHLEKIGPVTELADLVDRIAALEQRTADHAEIDEGEDD